MIINTYYVYDTLMYYFTSNVKINACPRRSVKIVAILDTTLCPDSVMNKNTYNIHT